MSNAHPLYTPMENKEIEIKLLFKNKKSIIAALQPQIKSKGYFFVRDTYFGHKNTTMENTHELFRIRETNKKNTELTLKGKAADKKNIWHRTELTIKIDSSETAREILAYLGFQKIREYESRKEHWDYDGAEITFAKFFKPARLEFMEIEGKSNKQIRALVKKLENKVQEAGEEIFKVFDK